MKIQPPGAYKSYAIHGLCIVGCAVLAMAPRCFAQAQSKPANDSEVPIRELFVPYEDLNVLLESNANHVFLTRQQYDALVAKAKQTPAQEQPTGALVVAANYHALLADHRVEITGTIEIDVLSAGMQRVPLPMASVGVLDARLDGKPAAIAANKAATKTLFVEGVGRHVLELKIHTPLFDNESRRAEAPANSAHQWFTVQLPTASASEFHLIGAGDFQMVGHGQVIDRRYDASQDQTAMQLMLVPGANSFAIGNGSRQLRSTPVVVARSVRVHEVTESFERLHSTVSMDVLHGAVEEFRFQVPEGFEITGVQSPLMSKYQVNRDSGKSILSVSLRSPTRSKEVLSITAENSAIKRPSEEIMAWTSPRLVPLGVVGGASVVGVLLDGRLQLQELKPQGLIPIDNKVITEAIPESVFEVEAGAPQIRPVAAYYAPQSEFSLTGAFRRPVPVVDVVTSLMLTISQQNHALRGQFALSPLHEELFDVRIQVPPRWQVTGVWEVVDGKERALEFDTRSTDNAANNAANNDPQSSGNSLAAGTVALARLPTGIPAGQTREIRFSALHTSDSWLGDWDQQNAEFPQFSLIDATDSAGILAVIAEDDLAAAPEGIKNLEPTNDREKAKLGLKTAVGALAYQFDSPDWQLRLNVTRIEPIITAESITFFKVQPDALVTHSEILYDVSRAGTRQLSFTVPSQTPTTLSITGSGATQVKGYTSEMIGQRRRWTANLAERISGQCKLVIDFQSEMRGQQQQGLKLTIPEASDVRFQSALFAVEGHGDFDVRVNASQARIVDVGKLSAADYRPGSRLLGAYEFLDKPSELSLDVDQRPGYGLPPVIVQKSELATLVSAHGNSQTEAKYQLRTKASYLEVLLPPGSTLWSMQVDGVSAKPQLHGESLLVDLPHTSAEEVRQLQVVYQMPIDEVGAWGSFQSQGPQLFLRSDDGKRGGEVPVTQVNWNVYLPAGYTMTRQSGTAISSQVQGLPLPMRRIWESFQSLFFGPRMPTVLYSIGGEAIATDAQEGLEFPQSKDEKDEGLIALGELYDSGVPPPEAASEANVSASMGIESERRLGRIDGVSESFQYGRKKLSEKREAGKSGKSGGQAQSFSWAIDGSGSLPIAIDHGRSGQVVSLTSLGAVPQLSATVIDARRCEMAGYAVAILVVLGGLLILGKRLRYQMMYVAIVVFVANLIPSITGLEHALFTPCTIACAAALMLLPLYGCWALARVIAAKTRSSSKPATTGKSMVASSIMILLGAVSVADAQNSVPGGLPSAPVPVYPVPKLPVPESPDRSQVIDLEKLGQWLEHADSVKLPRGAVVVPYHADAPGDPLVEAEKLLVPYETYTELWNRAYPDKALDAAPLPEKYALAGVVYETQLTEHQFLTLSGRLLIDSFSASTVMVPLPIGQVAFERANLDGKAARLRMLAPADAGARQSSSQQSSSQQASNQQSLVQSRSVPQANAVVALEITGQGRHVFEFSLRMPLSQSGGWREASALIPLATATSVTVRVPKADTELKFSGVVDHDTFTTGKDDESVTVAPAADARFAIKWRPHVALGQIDDSLTAETDAVVDVQEDGVRAAWQLNLSFPRSRRSTVSLWVPEDYLIESIQGDNVRSWQSHQESGKQRAEVVLSKEAVGTEQITLLLAKSMVLGKQSQSLGGPVVAVDGAALHTGQIQIRRSPLLDVVASKTKGLVRTDASDARIAKLTQQAGYEQSPLGIRTFQAYRFNATSFELELTSAPVGSVTSAQLQTILRIAPRQWHIESMIHIDVKQRPIHMAQMLIPASLQVDSVAVGGLYQWATSELKDDPEHQLLSVYLAAGVQGHLAVRLKARAVRDDPQDDVPIPQLTVLDMDRQQGTLAVQIDPAYSATASQLQNCETALRETVNAWLKPEQRKVTSLAITYRNPGYSGVIRVAPQAAVVKARTFTNVHLTERTIEELIVIALDVSGSGIRQFSFLLPQELSDATIEQSSMQRRTLSAVAGRPDLIRVTIHLQDDLMGQVRAAIRNTRLLVGDSHSVPVAEIENAETIARFVTLENDGRDELLVDDPVGLETLGHLHRQRRALAEALGTQFGDAFIVNETAPEHRLTFRTRQRASVQTAGARIGKAETVLIVDSAGTYRGGVEYRINNDTEQFLEIQLPADAQLWTASVAGQPVKPTLMPDTTSRDFVRIPLVKTAEGDTDYAVVLKYGGSIDLQALRSQVEFPLIHTKNIHCEMSQVQLRLPRSHRWYRFGGTMQQTLDEGDYRALDLKHLTQQLRMLSSALTSTSKYSASRAAANLNKLDSVRQHWERSYSDSYSSNAAVQQELQFNDYSQQQAAQQVAANRRKTLEAAGPDNRDRLRSYVAGSTHSRSRRLVEQYNDLGNFADPSSAPAQESLRRSEDTDFDSTWFLNNGLAQDAKNDGKPKRVSKQAAKGQVAKDQADVSRWSGAMDAEASQRKRSKAEASRMAERFFQGQQELPSLNLADKVYSDPFGNAPAGSEPFAGAAVTTAPNSDDPFGSADGEMTEPASGGYDGDFAGAGGGAGGGDRSGSGAMGGYGMPSIDGEVPAPVPNMVIALADAIGSDGEKQDAPATGDPTYLASLEMQLPLDQDGQTFFFTAPRGQIEIHATAISQAAMTRATRLGVMGLVMLVCVGIWATGRRVSKSLSAAP